MNTTPNYRSICAIVILLSAFLTASHASEEAPSEFSWPTDRVLPRFPTPQQSMDVISVQSLSRDEQVMFAALQGHVNKTQPRIWLRNDRSEEGRDTWFQSLNLQVQTEYDQDTKYDLLKKYTSELQGLVLYDVEHSDHMRNLASTVAGLKRALPVTTEIHSQLKEIGIDLPVVEGLTSLELNTPVEIYTHLYDRYWKSCEKRFLVSARPTRRRGDYHHTRDLAAACGAATLWLDNRIPEERNLFRKFLSEMPTGNAVVLGWYTTERSGVTTASEFGIGTLPADHFMNATVFSGFDSAIQTPTPPAPPKLENKCYIAIFLSDGDNIQYTQHALRRIWDRSSEVRGKMPLNWTISPALVDIAPEILNYYYTSATQNDCFVSGPSGMGYLIPVNTLKEPGAPLGIILNNEAYMQGFAQLSASYLQRAGLRMVTVWDNMSPMHRKLYEANCPDLLGVTVQNFKDDPTVESSLEGNRLRFERLKIPYTGSFRHLQTSIQRWSNRWSGEAPQFAAYQADIWSELKPERLIEFMERTKRENPQIEFVRADHYFQLQAEARKQTSETLEPPEN